MYYSLFIRIMLAKMNETNFNFSHHVRKYDGWAAYQIMQLNNC